MLLYELILFRDGGCFASSNEIDTEYLSQKMGYLQGWRGSKKVNIIN